MTYRELLPEDCPPDDAEEVTGPRVVYRLVRNNPPTDEDFRSQRAENPERVFPEVTECQTRGLSVWVDLTDATDLLRLRNMRGRLVCQVQLDLGAGHLMQTGRYLSHRTWWPLADFDILTECSLVMT